MRSPSTTLPILLSAILILSLLTTPTLAATPTSFCKCINTKSKKSMIIPLDQPTSSTTSGWRIRSSRSIPRRTPREVGERKDNDLPPADGAPPPYKPKTCSDCTKSFCLDLGLPDFKDVDGEDVRTDCFQRDSAKDEAVVFIFIIATVSLLAWALGKPVVEKYWGKARSRRRYIPVVDTDADRDRDRDRQMNR